MTREAGIAVKCATCGERIWVPLDEFNGNFGEIKGLCPKCMKRTRVTIIVCDNDAVESLMKEDEE